MRPEEIEFAPDLPYCAPRLSAWPLAGIEPRQVRWLVPGWIPYKTVTLVAGVGGLGKSTLLAGIAAQVSRGDLGGEPGNVLLVSFEDTAAEVLRPRVEAAGGDLNRVFTVKVAENDFDPVCLPHDIAHLRGIIEERQIRLVVIDPIVAGIDTALDAHKDQHVRSVLAQLAALADELDVAIVMVGHLNKTPSRDAYLRIGGSTAFYNAARSVLLVTQDKDDEEMRLVSQHKANYSRRRPVERHRIEEIVLPGTFDPDTGEPITTSRTTFVEVADDVDEDDLLAPREGHASSKESQAMKFLVRELAGGDWEESSPVRERAESEGISERTLQRAMKDLGVEVERRGFPSFTYWRLSRAKPSPPSLARLEEPLGYAENTPSSVPVAPVAPNRVGHSATGGTGNGKLVLEPEYEAAIQRAIAEGLLDE